MKRCVAFAVVLLFSCGSKTSVPEGVLPVPKMTAVLWDVMVADALANNRFPLDTFTRFDTSVMLYQQIAKAHGTTQAQLKQSLRFYQGRPDLLQVIIDTLQKRSITPVIAGDTTKKKPFQRPIDPLRGL